MSVLSFFTPRNSGIPYGNTGLESVEVVINTFDQVSKSQVGSGINLYSISERGVALLPYTALPNGFELKINSKDTPLFRSLEDPSQIGKFQPPTPEEVRNPKYSFNVDPGSYLYMKVIVLRDGSTDTIFRYKWPVKTYSVNTLPLAQREQINKISVNVPLTNVQVPSSFDSRQKWSDSITNSLNQLQCGSCWAFATATCFSDRYRIRNINNRNDPKVAELFETFNYVVSSEISYTSLNNVSPYQLVQRDTGGDERGCDGGVIDSAFQFLVNNGLNSMKSIRAQPPIPNKSVYQGVLLGKITEMNSSSASNDEKMQAIMKIKQEIFSHGPVCAGFTVYNDFYNYQSGVYNGGDGGIAGGHAVTIVGWGPDYWIVRNSWGSEWGMNGFFNIALDWTPPNAFDSSRLPTLGILDEISTIAAGA